MNKENKKQAKERKAKEREKQARRKRISDILGLWVPIILIVAVLVVLIVAIATSGADSEGAEDDSEFGLSYVDEDGNEVEITDWTEVDEDEEDYEDEEDSGLDTTEGLIVADGDTVNIDYVGKVDGVAFEGGDTQGMGADLTIGSGAYIDGFEDAIIGHAVGETFDLTVTFPENYGVDELNGKEAVFTTTINGIYK